jgi:demethoxyubiquinone hydroxylase (CLK1/Coq7/Cat5 family)
VPFLREPSFSRTVSRILRVDYACEYGAVRIYGAQIFVAKRLHCAVCPSSWRRSRMSDVTQRFSAS